MMTFWNSVMVLRRIEVVALLATMIVPILCGTVLLTVRHRIKTLLNQTSESQGVSYEENVQRLQTKTHELGKELENAREELTALRRMTARRQITESQENILLEKLRSVKASPVIVAAYSFEEESAAYATEIAGVLRKANWDVTLNKASMNDFKGISLGSVNLANRPLTGLHELAQALMAAHVDLHQRDIAPESIAGSLQDGSLLVVVGRK
jgi:hypothetical protein